MFRAVLLALLPTLIAAQQRPNILLIVTDDQRWDHLGLLHPHLKTPVMDSLAAEGVRFRQAFVTTSICAASRASLLTGCFERTHGYTFGTPPLQRRFTDGSWPRRLRNAGYRTGHVGKFGVRVEKGAAKEMFHVFRPRGAPYMKKQPDGSTRHLTDITGDDAREFIQSAPADRPWALTVAFNAPHAEDPNKDQYIWPPSEDGLYDDVNVPPPPHASPEFFNSQPAFIRESLCRIRWKWRFDDEAKRQRMTKGYWRMITGVDRNIGEILRAVSDRGQSDETVVIFTSDNGYFLGDRGFAGKWLPYEASLRVPLIIRGLTGTPKGATRDHTVLNVDIPATICELAGTPPPADNQGRSLLDAARDEAEGWREDFFFEHLFNHKSIPKLEGVRTQRFKYSRYFEQDPPFEELYDLENDPTESTNLAARKDAYPTLWKLRARCDTLRERYREKRDGSRARRGSDRPNMVLIIGDDQHWSDYGFMGSDQVRTPRLDQLAKQGLVFERGYLPTSLCCPSLASLATGLPPHRHRVTGNEPPRPKGRRAARNAPAYRQQVRQMVALIDESPTLPAILRDRGYWSLQTGKWWLGNYRRGGFTHGMTHGVPARGGRHGDDGLRIGRQGLQEVWDFVDAAEDRPFFLWYAPFLPHRPHNPPPRLLDPYRGSHESIHVTRYRAMCTWLDESVGQLMDGLEARGLADDTLFVFLCDNGWIQRTDNSGYAPRSKRSPYDGGLRTPIVLRWKGRIEPGRSQTPVISTDIVTTLLARLGAAPSTELPGIDLLDPDAVKHRGPLHGGVYRHNAVDIMRPEANLTHRWAVDGRWKLIAPTEGAPQLFDVSKDPEEKSDQAASQQAVVERLMAGLKAWWPEGN